MDNQMAIAKEFMVAETDTPDKRTQSTTEEAFERMKEQPQGDMEYGLTNDYMFRAVFQKNEKALRGLLSAVLHLKPGQITSVEIKNPIILGKSYDWKECILDIRLLLDGKRQIDLEMQMGEVTNWPKRSVYYLCVMFTDLMKGRDYRDAKPCLHIGFVTRSPFGGKKQFFSDYKLREKKTGHVYLDEFEIVMLDMSQTDVYAPDDTDDKEEVRRWVRLLKATSWKEVLKMAEHSECMKEAVVTMHELSQEEKIREQCLARALWKGDLEGARDDGRAEGREQELIEAFQELGQTYDFTMNRLMTKFSLSQSDAESRMKLYWKE